MEKFEIVDFEAAILLISIFPQNVLLYCSKIYFLISSLIMKWNFIRSAD